MQKNKLIYNPKVFDTNSIEEAKKVILTNEQELQSDDRWEKESPYIIKSIIEKTKLCKDSIVLDFGCGIGRISKLIVQNIGCRVIGVDISESMRNFAKEYVDCELFEVYSPAQLLEKLQKENLEFDLAISIWVLQHCPNVEDEIKFLRKAIKDEGELYIVNNKFSAIPTNKGWIKDKNDISLLLEVYFENNYLDKLPDEVTSKRVSDYTFEAIYKNIKDESMSENEQKEIEELLSKAFEYYKQKEYKHAELVYKRLIRLEPNSSKNYCNLGVVLKLQKKYNLAISAYIKAIQLDNKNSLAFNNLGNLFKEIKDYNNSIRAFNDAIKANPKDFNAYNNLGILYEKIGDNNKAIEFYKNAVKVNNKFAKAINNIGVVLYKQKKYEEATKIFKIALEVNVDYDDVYSNLGAALNKNKQYDEAIEVLNEAIRRRPNHGGAYTNLGNVYNKIYDYKSAAKMHEKSIELEPNGENAYGNLGTSYKYLGRFNDAINVYKKAIELKPDFVNAHFDLGIAYLMLEDYENGWREYEWRFKKDEMLSHMKFHEDIFTKPMYVKGDDMKGKTLLIHSEQGFGDSIQFVRFIPKLKELTGAKIAFKTRQGLKELFSSIKEIDILVDRDELTPKFDKHLPLLSIPYVLDMKSNKDIPNTNSYLIPIKNQDISIKKEKGKIDIGICWSASTSGESYDGKVFSLEYLIPLINEKKFNIYSLQVGTEKEDIKKLGLENKIIDLTDKLDNFAKTASLIDKLDLVISSDTSVAHLCGALGKEVWIPLQKTPDWRWQRKGETSPWYKSAKLFRQKTNRVWDSVFESIYAKVSKKYKVIIKK